MTFEQESFELREIDENARKVEIAKHHFKLIGLPSFKFTEKR